jgi:hypothetical protein
MVQKENELSKSEQRSLSALSADATGQLNIFGHDRHTLGMNGTQVGVFEQSNKVGFRSFLKGEDSGRLEAKIILEVLGDFTNEALERSFADQEFGGLLVFAVHDNRIHCISAFIVK